MRNLFEMINVSTNENNADGDYASITHEEWQEHCESCDKIHSALESIGVDGDFECYFDVVRVIEDRLNHLYPGDTVYFWLD